MDGLNTADVWEDVLTEENVDAVAERFRQLLLGKSFTLEFHPSENPSHSYPKEHLSEYNDRNPIQVRRGDGRPPRLWIYAFSSLGPFPAGVAELPVHFRIEATEATIVRQLDEYRSLKMVFRIDEAPPAEPPFQLGSGPWHLHHERPELSDAVAERLTAFLNGGRVVFVHHDSGATLRNVPQVKVSNPLKTGERCTVKQRTTGPVVDVPLQGYAFSIPVKPLERGGNAYASYVEIHGDVAQIIVYYPYGSEVASNTYTLVVIRPDDEVQSA